MLKFILRWGLSIIPGHQQDPLILCLMATRLANNGEGAVILGKVAEIIYRAGKENYV